MLQDIVIQKYNKQITNNDNEKTNSIIHENNNVRDEEDGIGK